jgi:hypothetical protein
MFQNVSVCAIFKNISNEGGRSLNHIAQRIRLHKNDAAPCGTGSGPATLVKNAIFSYKPHKKGLLGFFYYAKLFIAVSAVIPSKITCG